MFDLERLKAALAEKITSIDAFVEVLDNSRTSGYVRDYLPSKDDKGRWRGDFSRYLISEARMPYASNACMQLKWQLVTPSRWWMVREAMRVAMGLRTTLHEVLDHDRSLIQALDSMFAYISTSDPTKVAFTASIEDGERDKQTIASLGRFGRLAQVAWVFGDDKYRDAESALRAEMCSDLEILTGPAIEEAWQVGPESCMTEKQYRASGGGYWDRAQVGTHPVMVFDAPGWGVAIIRNGERISQRAVVYVDAVTGDKSYVRVYGTGPLERRLKRNGYVNRVPYGAKLKLMRAAFDQRYVVVPYLDGAGGTNDGNGVCIEGGWLKVIDRETVNKYRNINSYYSSQGTTGGYVELEEPNLQPWTSLFGNEGDAFATKYRAARIVDGAIVRGYVTNDEAYRHSMYDCYVPLNGARESMRVAPEHRMTIDRNVWIRHIDSMPAAGYVAVSEEHAAILRANKLHVRTEFDTTWAWASDMHVMPDGTQVPDVSMVHVIAMKDGAVTTDLMHDSQLKKGVHKKIRSFNTRRAYVTEGVPVVVVERNGKGFKSVVGLHADISRSALGTVCFAQDFVRLRVGSKVYNFAPSDIRENEHSIRMPKTLPEGARGYLEEYVSGYVDVSTARQAWPSLFRAMERMYNGWYLQSPHALPRESRTDTEARAAYAKLKTQLESISHPAIVEMVAIIDEKFPTLFAEPAPVAVEPEAAPAVETNILTLAA